MSTAEVKTEEKVLITLKEARALSGIGETRMYKILNSPDCTFSVRFGRTHMVHKEKFIAWLGTVKEI